MDSIIKVKTYKVSFPDVRLPMRDASKLRGFVARLFAEHDEFHNHGETGWIYRYPLIQYKVIAGVPHIIGINSGAEKLAKAEEELQELVFGEKHIPLFAKNLVVGDEKIGVADKVYHYSFVTPWMPLNQNNYQLYCSKNMVNRRELLKSILIGNILALSKGLGYHVAQKIVVDLGSLKTLETHFKNQPMLTFVGDFWTNFLIPEGLGIGKSVSRGFGTIKRVGRRDHTL